MYVTTESKVQYKFLYKIVFVGTLKVTDEESRGRSRIRIRNQVYGSKYLSRYQNVTDPELHGSRTSRIQNMDKFCRSVHMYDTVEKIVTGFKNFQLLAKNRAGSLKCQISMQ
jgi:hypothetical protein